MVSLDQVHRIKERQDSPTNSPNGKKEYENLVETLISNNHVLSSSTTSRCSKISDKKSGGLTELDAGYVSPLALSVQEDDEVARACTPDSQQSKDIDSGCEDTPPATELFDNDMDMNPDQFAPFIPPPVGDSRFFVDCMEVSSMDETLGDEDLMWSNESWEIYDTEADLRAKKDADIRRNLSTPKFFPPEDDLPILNSNEVEMSTPMSNLPLLQGNEIWFALDQGKTITV